MNSSKAKRDKERNVRKFDGLLDYDDGKPYDEKHEIDLWWKNKQT